MSKYSLDTENLNKFRQGWIDENEKIKTRTYAEWIDMYTKDRQHQNKWYRIEYNEEKEWTETELGETYDIPFELPYLTIGPSHPNTEEGKKYMKDLKEYIHLYKEHHSYNRPQSLSMIPVDQGYVGTKTVKRSNEPSELDERIWGNIVTYLNESPPDIAEETVKRLISDVRGPRKHCEYESQPQGKYIRIDGKWIKEE